MKHTHTLVLYELASYKFRILIYTIDLLNYIFFDFTLFQFQQSHHQFNAITKIAFDENGLRAAHYQYNVLSVNLIIKHSNLNIYLYNSILYTIFYIKCIKFNLGNIDRNQLLLLWLALFVIDNFQTIESSMFELTIKFMTNKQADKR